EVIECIKYIITIDGDIEATSLQYIIRDFHRNQYEARKQTMTTILQDMQTKYGTENISYEITDQYYNMREKIEPVKEVVTLAEDAMKQLDITPIIEPIRGGTDGSQLSYMGLPTPNIFTGGENFHGKYEFISVQNMEKAVQVLVRICALFEKNA